MRRKPILILIAALAAALLAAPASQAAFPGANGKIAFDAPGASSTDIYTINPDGSGLTDLTTVTFPQDSDIDQTPAWSPDGKLITWERLTGGAWGVWVMNGDGTNPQQLSTVTGTSGLGSPAFFGNNAQIAFARFASGFNIWVTNSDDSGAAVQRSTGGGDLGPTVSTDSQSIAFYREGFTGGGEAIMTMPSGGGTQTAQTPTDGTVLAEGPNFSPDGSQLTFSRCEKDPGNEVCPIPPEIVRMSSGGGAITEVTSNSGSADPSDIDPVYSPDGTRIAFARIPTILAGGSIFTVPSGGGVATMVPNTANGENPDWQPVAATSTPGTPGGGGTAGLKAGELATCFHESVTIFGTNRSEKIVGTPGNDVIRGFRGRDKINGKGGEDILCGGRGKDKIFGKNGDDILIGGDGSDFLKGGRGINRLFGGTPGAPIEKANNVCVGGKNDTLSNCQVIR